LAQSTGGPQFSTNHGQIMGLPLLPGYPLRLPAKAAQDRAP
jgi:hypothetical protein